MTQETITENRCMLESYAGARARLYAYILRMEKRLRRERVCAERTDLKKRLETLYQELEELSETIRTLRGYCKGGAE